MTLTWYGLSSFKITNTGGEVTIITDPFHKDSGLTPPRGAADIVVISRPDELHSNTDGMTGNPLIIKNAGEFDVKGVHISGIYPQPPSVANPSGIDDAKKIPATVFLLEVDAVKIGFLGVFGERELTEHQLEEMGDIDVLIVPVGGNHGVINWEWASHIVQQVEPRFVVPCYFKQNGVIFDLDSPDKFLKEMGGEPKTEDRLTLKSKDLMTDSTTVVVLNPQR
ncbi:MAG: hypothetical protein A3J48_02035 [Candidatus Doudnabacteria bacterium RIFCSPHIGHO2_02_FULL_46_11]|uniref:Zn-dependent hydrolase n=1 Tax=Candidatus Doudnabacteria bacterium RIFCSPHIGHO2_02_FULL_46_11 TaxID=1817832 RepID=A0A1F5P4U0_9BACT|nr:MAG: hypothetical protein A3J48_02035 [Candidatus Doudnabacteria bacterium RIFCSPHIGHO2_02_FULL_46_11]